MWLWKILAGLDIAGEAEGAVKKWGNNLYFVLPGRAHRLWGFCFFFSHRVMTWLLSCLRTIILVVLWKDGLEGRETITKTRWRGQNRVSLRKRKGRDGHETHNPFSQSYIYSTSTYNRLCYARCWSAAQSAWKPGDKDLVWEWEL